MSDKVKGPAYTICKNCGHESYYHRKGWTTRCDVTGCTCQTFQVKRVG